MKRLSHLLATIVSLLSLTGAAQAGSIPWSHDYETARSNAKQSSKLILLDLYTDWCGWCKKLDKDVYTNATVVKTAEQFVPVRLNGEAEGQALVTQLKVSGYPAIFVLNSEGVVAGKIDGYQPPDQFVASLKDIVSRNAEFPGLQARVQAHPADMPAAQRLIATYLMRQRIEDAAKLADQILPKIDAKQVGKITDDIAFGYANSGDTDQAIAWFQRTLAKSTDTKYLVGAHVGLYSIYAEQREVGKMKGELKAVINMPNAPASVKNGARRILSNLEASE